MDFALSDEQRQLRGVARDFFAQHRGTAVARDYLDRLVAPVADMSKALGSMGFLGVLADGAVGGTDGTVTDLVVIAEQAGYHLVAAPLISTAAQGVSLLDTAVGQGVEAAREMLEAVLEGAQTVAVLDPRGLRRTGETVHGTVAPVPQGASADLAITVIDDVLVVLALTDESTVRRHDPRALDPTRELAGLTFDGCRAVTVLADPEVTGAAWRRARSLGMLVLAAECGGVVDAALALGVDYAKQRYAFGRPIGSFQAVKHSLVEIYILAEQLRSLVWLAAARADSGQDFGRHARGALAYALDAGLRATDTLIQVHGGVGVTWEHDAHLYWRRARTDRDLFGGPDELRYDIAAGLIAEATDRQGVPA